MFGQQGLDRCPLSTPDLPKSFKDAKITDLMTLSKNRDEGFHRPPRVTASTK